MVNTFGNNVDYAALLLRYADGRSLCNCHRAYSVTVKEGASSLVNGQWVKVDAQVCGGPCGTTAGCATSVILCTNYVAKRALADVRNGRGVDDEQRGRL